MAWGPTLTAGQETTLLDRQSKVNRDVVGFDVAIPVLEDQRDAANDAQGVDRVFFDWFHAVADAYEDEWQYIVGEYEDDYAAGPPRTGKIGEGDLEDAVNDVNDCRLFSVGYADTDVPDSSIDELNIVPLHAPNWERDCEIGTLPLAADPIGTHYLVRDCVWALNNGLDNGTGPAATTSGVTPVSATVDIDDISLFTNNDYAVILVGNNYAVVEITGGAGGVPPGTPGTLNIIVHSINVAAIAFPADISSVTAVFQGAADNRMAVLLTVLDNQITALGTNNDDISSVGVAALNSAASANALATRTTYNSWLLSGTRFVAGQMNALLAAMAAREAFTATRRTQIDAAALDIYTRRAKWLDTLVNRAIGSWTEYLRTATGITMFQAHKSTRNVTDVDYTEWLVG